MGFNGGVNGRFMNEEMQFRVRDTVPLSQYIELELKR